MKNLKAAMTWIMVTVDKKHFYGFYDQVSRNNIWAAFRYVGHILPNALEM